MLCVYYLNGTLLLEAINPNPPAEGAEVCLDGVYYRVHRSIQYIDPIPPWRTHIHLKVEPEVSSS